MRSVAGKGVGDHLHQLIKRWTGQDFRPGCECREFVVRMNHWGPAGCREHMDEILAKLKAQADKRGLWGVLAKIPGSTVPLRWLVEKAIEQAEAEPVPK